VTAPLSEHLSNQTERRTVMGRWVLAAVVLAGLLLLIWITVRSSPVRHSLLGVLADGS
jgi:hypothetical protein